MKLRFYFAGNSQFVLTSLSIHREIYMCALCPWEYPTCPSQVREETIIISADFEGEMWVDFTWHFLRFYQTCVDLAVPICHARLQKCSQCHQTWLAGALRGCEQAAALSSQDTPLNTHQFTLGLQMLMRFTFGRRSLQRLSGILMLTQEFISACMLRSG